MLRGIERAPNIATDWFRRYRRWRLEQDWRRLGFGIPVDGNDQPGRAGDRIAVLVEGHRNVADDPIIGLEAFNESERNCAAIVGGVHESSDDRQ